MIKTELLLLILSLIGSLIAVGVAGNAFFLRGIFGDLNDVKLNIARIFERSTHNDRAVEDLRTRVDNIEKELLNSKERLHSLEGERGTLLNYLNDIHRELRENK